MRKLIRLAIIALLIFIGMLYYVLRTKVTNVSEEEPYSEIINKTLYLKRPAFIAKNVDRDIKSNPYLIMENDSDFLEEVKESYLLPVGTPIKINAANLYTNGTSGFSSAYVLGTVYLAELKKEVEFEYEWGMQHVVIYGDAKDNWTFPMAVWQDKEDKRKYEFE